jgi:hypothetical protein
MNRLHPTGRARQRQANFRGVLIHAGIPQQYQADREADYVHHASGEQGRAWCVRLCAILPGRVLALWWVQSRAAPFLVENTEQFVTWHVHLAVLR